MRDPDLVHRAERAATALERAWGRWRTMHGLGSDPPPPVSSYVGYSLEEPWGQPRVVFGIGADEAELLASLLDGHDCVGPIHAEVTSRPDWRHGPEVPARSLPDQLSIPAQAPQPRSETTSSGETREVDAATTSASARAATASKAGVASPAGKATDDPQQGAPPDVAETAETAEAPALAQPGVVAFRRRADQDPDGEPAPEPGEVELLEPLEPVEALEPLPMATSHDVTPNPGPGHRGPRYQGQPPQYHDDPELADPVETFAAAPVADFEEPPPVSQRQRGKSRQLSKLGRSRRTGPGAHEAWDSADDQPADHAV